MPQDVICLEEVVEPGESQNSSEQQSPDVVEVLVVRDGGIACRVVKPTIGRLIREVRRYAVESRDSCAIGLLRSQPDRRSIKGSPDCTNWQWKQLEGSAGSPRE